MDDEVVIVSSSFASVVGFLNASFSGVEQGPGHSVPVGYLKGGTIAGQNLIFDVTSIPGTARSELTVQFKVLLITHDKIY